LQRLLAQDGHEVTHALDLARGQSDPRQFLNALDRSAVLVTQNASDFILVQRAWRLWTQRWGVDQRHPGIIGVPVWLAPKMRDEIHQVLALAPLDNEMFVWDRVRGWHTVELL